MISKIVVQWGFRDVYCQYLKTIILEIRSDFSFSGDIGDPGHCNYGTQNKVFKNIFILNVLQWTSRVMCDAWWGVISSMIIVSCGSNWDSESNKLWHFL